MSDESCQEAPHPDEAGTKSGLCRVEENSDVRSSTDINKLASTVSPRPQAVLTLLNSGDSSYSDESSGDSCLEKEMGVGVRRVGKKGSCMKLLPKPSSEYVDSVRNSAYVCV